MWQPGDRSVCVTCLEVIVCMGLFWVHVEPTTRECFGRARPASEEE